MRSLRRAGRVGSFAGTGRGVRSRCNRLAKRAPWMLISTTVPQAARHSIRHATPQHCTACEACYLPC